jgi:hypothetical protein
MIISASYRTDIPAFYGDWFVARLDAGFCRTVNPYGRQVHTVKLDPDAVSGFVFWTKNLGPFRAALDVVRDRGFPFVVQYTINDYPRALETSVTDAGRAIGHMRDLAREFGPRAGVWRYDPVVATSMTPPGWHVDNFTRLADRLAGATDEAVVSFAHIYRKTRVNLDAAARLHGFAWRDPADDEKRDLAHRLAAIAADRGMRLTVCSQEAYLVPGAAPARCIDAERLSDVAGKPIAARHKGNRPGCMCAESRDIGDYDTCPHGCVYCYAVRTRALARRRHGAHRPDDPLLSPPLARVKDCSTKIA